MKQQRSFIVVFIGLFSFSLLASMFGFSLVEVTAKVLPKPAAATFSLAGEVRGVCPSPCMPPGGPLLSGVTITFTRISGTGATPLPVQTDAGKWSQMGFEEGTTYRVTPSGLGNNYAPAFLDLSATSNQILFIVAPATYSVAGRVTFNGVGLEGVQISFTSPSQTAPQPVTNTLTDANGNWSADGFRFGVVPYSAKPSKAGYVFAPCGEPFYAPSARIDFEALLPSLVAVSSADFTNRPGYCGYSSVARESIVSIFGSNLAAASQIATSQPLPTELAGTIVKFKSFFDNSERFAPLFFVSPSQINLQIPPGADVGAASITVLRDGVVVNQSIVEITYFQPAIFTADASGKGLPAAVAYRLKANGLDSYEPISRFDPVQGKIVAVPIEFGDETDQVFLVLFGTGGMQLLQYYSATIGGTPAQVTYVGLQPSYVGLIQTNILLPRSLIGRGDAEVKLRVFGIEANPVTINIR